eukprot:CAMPEP_0194201966 /NCGR_PEP_ID=MMETSP0156-20130528/2110_1 /TAXON_ID=33649 /ORGANISM="Thalassionema nitzschioides, Strain L26-B" /LENGTH=951 /DNA_ID=CAMNT_0038927319 /DNA_START=131 /DNA_END=2986 /DNA_ORIENTATION=-
MPQHALSAQKDVAYAVNYSIPSVEAFVVPTPRRKHDFSVDSTKRNTRNPATNKKRPRSEMGEVVDIETKDETASSEEQDNNILENNTMTSSIRPVRKSQRQPKPRREFSNPSQFEKSRVRYDIHLVPQVKKNRDFLLYWRSQSILNHEANEDANEKYRKDKLSKPFIDDETVVWVPSSRSEWEDSISEMTSVCKSAALRRYVTLPNLSTNSKPFYAPLSREYIRDRIDIDDPLVGYQFRHKTGGWLQGFIMFTNFTTWSHYFKWDSMHAGSGVQGSQKLFKVDSDGSLAIELEAQERSGDPLAGGIVFPSIAEISLVGALGCGEYLLRMSLDEIYSREQYQYIVLQATDSSRTFYEKFGFVRVGAISRYGPRMKGRRPSNYSPSLSDIVGYRHWTYAHESEQSLGKHGGPSYMMVLRINRSNTRKGKAGSFLETMMNYSVPEKPKVKQVGIFTPLVKKTFEGTTIISTPSDLNMEPVTVSSVEKTPARKRGRPPLSEHVARHSNSPTKSAMEHSTKKRRLNPSNDYKFMKQREELLTPPPPGKSLSYAQKQYQSIWLAVPPKGEATPRRPPRERQQIEKTPERRYSKKRVINKKKEDEVSDDISQVQSKALATASYSMPLEIKRSKENEKDSTSTSTANDVELVVKSDVKGDSKNDAALSIRCQTIKNSCTLKSSMDIEALSNDDDNSNFTKKIDDSSVQRRRSLRSRSYVTTCSATDTNTTKVLSYSSSITKSQMHGFSIESSKPRRFRNIESPRLSDTSAMSSQLESSPNHSFKFQSNRNIPKRRCKVNYIITKRNKDVKRHVNEIITKDSQSLEKDNIETKTKTRLGKKLRETNKSPPIREIKKQKPPSSPECPPNELNFFNKVVKRKKSSNEHYYYVLNFDVDKMLLKICPLYRQGVFIGKRSGRTRWKLEVNNKILHETAENFEIVPTQMVAKTPFVANETWDILD